MCFAIPLDWGETRLAHRDGCCHCRARRAELVRVDAIQVLAPHRLWLIRTLSLARPTRAVDRVSSESAMDCDEISASGVSSQQGLQPMHHPFRIDGLRQSGRLIVPFVHNASKTVGTGTRDTSHGVTGKGESSGRRGQHGSPGF